MCPFQKPMGRTRLANSTRIRSPTGEVSSVATIEPMPEASEIQPITCTGWLAIQPGSIDILRDLVMPALARTGVLTKRARAVLEDKGITVYDDTTVLEALENPETGIVEL